MPSSATKFATVSKIINQTMPVESLLILRRWQEKMRKEMGENEFNEYMKKIKGLGQCVHENVSDLLLHKKELSDIPSQIEGYISSLKCVLSRVMASPLVESDCSHPLLRYRGRFDSMNYFESETGPLVLTEWKTVHETKRVNSLNKTYDAPLQVAAYIGAYNVSRSPTLPEVRQGLIVYAYADGYPADFFVLSEESLEYFWGLWCNRVNLFHGMQKSSTT